MNNNFKTFIIWGAILFPSLVVISTTLFEVWFAPDESFYYNLAAALVMSWLLVLVLYYVWAIYFYNINLGWTDDDWAKSAAQRKTEGIAKEPDDNPNKEETLGLPPGTVRGTIALSILVGGLAMVIASFSMRDRLNQNEFFIDNFEFFKTAFLMVVAFYFGNKSLDFLKYRSDVKGPGIIPTATQTTDEAPTPEPLPTGDAGRTRRALLGDTEGTNRDFENDRAQG